MPTLSAADSLSAKKLLQALRRLQPNQGERARRNARQRVLSRLAALRSFVDEVYPAERRAPRKRGRRRAKQPTHIELRVGPYTNKVAGAGIRAQPCTISGVTTVLVPRWVEEVRRLDPTIAQLREARRSLTARRALLSQARLTQQGAQP